MDFLSTFATVLKKFESEGIDYMIVGSLAVVVYGEPRLTRDMDLVAEIRPDQAAVLPGLFPSPQYSVVGLSSRPSSPRGSRLPKMSSSRSWPSFAKAVPGNICPTFAASWRTSMWTKPMSTIGSRSWGWRTRGPV